VKVLFTPEALREIRRRRAWWEENRDKAPNLFREELATAVARLRAGQLEGAQLYTVHQSRKIWRLLMPKTKAHVYYRVDASRREVEVITVWNAISGDGPHLPP